MDFFVDFLNNFQISILLWWDTIVLELFLGEFLLKQNSIVLQTIP